MFDPCQQWNPKWKEPQFAKWSRTHKQASHTGSSLFPLRDLRGRKEGSHPMASLCVFLWNPLFSKQKIMHRNLLVERKACNIPCKAQHVFITLSSSSTHTQIHSPASPVQWEPASACLLGHSHCPALPNQGKLSQEIFTFSKQGRYSFFHVCTLLSCTSPQ